jgi:hypothetical protein
MLSTSSGVKISSKSDISDRDKSSIVVLRVVSLAISQVCVRLL